MVTPKLHFSLQINAPKETVWQTLWDDKTYRMWTSVFSEGSYAVSDWEEGSKILFLNANGDGMFSTIAKQITNEFISFKHLGIVKNNVEQPADEETKKWSGATETYSLKETKGTTTLLVEMDSNDEFKDYFNKTFPKALESVKIIAEKAF